jgi:hypothetical protein
MGRPEGTGGLEVDPPSKLARRFWLRGSWMAEKNCPCSGDKARQSFLYISAELTRLTQGVCARSAAIAGRDGRQGSNT